MAQGKVHKLRLQRVDYCSGMFWIQLFNWRKKSQASITDVGPGATVSICSKRIEGEIVR